MAVGFLFTRINIFGSVGNESGKRAQGFGAPIRNHHTSEQCRPAQKNHFGTSDESVKIGDLIYYRAEDSDHEEDVPQWMVVTQGPHKRCDCVSRNFHSKIIVSHKKCVKMHLIFSAILGSMFGGTWHPTLTPDNPNNVDFPTLFAYFGDATLPSQCLFWTRFVQLAPFGIPILTKPIQKSIQ